jgi:chromosome segregation ATPase
MQLHLQLTSNTEEGGSMATMAVETSPVEALEKRLEDLLGRFERSRQENSGSKTEVAALKSEVALLTSEGKTQRQEIAQLKSEVAELKSDNAALRAEGKTLKADRDTVRERISRLIGQVEERLAHAV